MQTYVLQMSAEAASDSGETMESVYTGPERTYMAEGLKPGRKYHARVSIKGVVSVRVWLDVLH